MARSIQVELEREADKKGLTGDERERYIGGAWQRIRGERDRHSWWRDPDEARLLNKMLGDVQEVKQPASRRADHVLIRSGETWYELPDTEYHALLSEARKAEALERGEDATLKRQHEREVRETERMLRDARIDHARAKKQAEREASRRSAEDARRKRAEARAIAEYERALELEQRIEGRKAAHQARMSELARRQEERIARSVERAQHSAVLDIIRKAGGIRRSVTQSGVEHERSEYNRLPKHVRARVHRVSDQKRGLTVDDAATEISQHMPWLHLETTDDLYQYFERMEDRRNNRRGVA